MSMFVFTFTQKHLHSCLSNKLPYQIINYCIVCNSSIIYLYQIPFFLNNVIYQLPKFFFKFKLLSGFNNYSEYFFSLYILICSLSLVFFHPQGKMRMPPRWEWKHIFLQEPPQLWCSLAKSWQFAADLNHLAARFTHRFYPTASRQNDYKKGGETMVAWIPN